MKLFKISFLATLAAMLVIGLTGSAFAFHDGGVAKCEGCHTMHNSLKSVKMSVSGSVLVGNQYLLIGSDASSTCLSCHGKGAALSGYHVATGTGSGAGASSAGYNGTTLPAQRTPGGDFSWLKVAFSTISTVAGKGMGASFAAPADESKNRHGHHIVAADYSYLASTDYASNQGPGGTYPVGSLGCNSCHNPHNGLTRDGSTLPISASGSYGDAPVGATAVGVYRFLGGAGYTVPGAGIPAFTADPPAAVAPATYNKSEATGQIRVAYGQGMSEWCANCHGNLINTNADATSTHRHVASNAAKLSTAAPLGEVPATIYQGYVNSGQTSGGSAASAYLTLVPYEMGVTDTATLLSATANDDASSAATGNVMCLSCHRAHASGFDSMARFDIANSFVTDPTGAYAFSGADHEMHPDTSGYYQAAYYEQPVSKFGPSQRSLCNKCHARD